ncbi:MAG: RDD family protein [Acidobacteria bacterium]|nr:RDD family protein [Acidobacteriota bacterium]
MTSAENEHTIVTPEHVEITLHPAGPGSRFFALFVDSLLVFALPVTVFVLLVPLIGGGLAFAVRVTIAFLLSWGYYVWFETRDGQTPGKRMAGIRVIDDRGLPITFQQAMIRNVVRVLDLAPILYGVGITSALIDRKNRRLGDIAARTLVVDDRRHTPAMTPFPASREFASVRDPRTVRLARNRLDLRQRQLIVDLVIRAEELDTAARTSLMDRTGAELRRLLQLDLPELSEENLVRGVAWLISSRRI